MADSFKELQAECLSRLRQIDAKALSLASQVGFESIEQLFTRLSIGFDNAIEHFDMAAYYLLAEMHRWRGLRTISSEKGLADGKEMLERVVPKSVEAFASNLRAGLGEIPLAEELAGDIAHEFNLKLRSKLYLCLDMLERDRPLPDFEAFSREIAQGRMRLRAGWWKARLARRVATSPGVSHSPQSADMEALRHAQATKPLAEPTQSLAVPNARETVDREAEKRELTPARSASWQAVHISFVSDNRVQVFNGIGSESYNYNELGFEDGRTGNPNQAWLMLRRLAESSGTISSAKQAGCEWPKVEKRIQEIRKVLRGRFGIAGDPIRYREGTGYEAAFKISLSRSFHS